MTQETKQTTIPALSAEAYEANQTIVKALTGALSTYKKEKLDRSFKKHIELDPQEFQVWIIYDTSYCKRYTINIRANRFRNENQDSPDRYPTDISMTIYTEGYSGEPKDWRAELTDEVRRHDYARQYAYEQTRKEWISQIEALNAKAVELMNKAKAFVSEKRKDAGFGCFDSDYALHKAFPVLFHYRDR